MTVTSGAARPVITRSEPYLNGWLVEAAWPLEATTTVDWTLSVTVLCAAINS